MIAREHRFHGHHSLHHIYRFGQTARADGVSLRYVASKQPDFRLAVVVSRKVSKLAVVRNRIRRRIFEIVRLYHKEQAAQWPYDLMITVHDARLATMSASDLQMHITSILTKATIIKH